MLSSVMPQFGPAIGSEIQCQRREKWTCSGVWLGVQKSTTSIQISHVYPLPLTLRILTTMFARFGVRLDLDITLDNAEWPP
jgi:hypothetical protein